jgi:hemerythrin
MAHLYPYTTWAPDLATGNALIDEQHKKWIAALNAIFDAYRTGKGRRGVEETMDFMLDYTVKHFNDEEEIQKKYEYPEYDKHHQIHTGFKGVVRELRRELIKEGPTDEVITNLYVTMGRWLINHIKDKDIAMAAYVRSKSDELKQE